MIKTPLPKSPFLKCVVFDSIIHKGNTNIIPRKFSIQKLRSNRLAFLSYCSWQVLSICRQSSLILLNELKMQPLKDFNNLNFKTKTEG